MIRGLLPVLLVCLAGCSVNTYHIGSELAEPAELPTTDRAYTLAEALIDFGPPHRISATPGGYVLTWEHWIIRQEKLGISMRPVGIEFLSIDWGDARTQGEFLVLGFDRNHEMVSSGYDTWDNFASGGQGIQPLSLVDVVDVEDLTAPMPQHNWGGFSLDELPVTLNADNRLDTGKNGTQQRGTPRGVGQHTLEMDTW